MIRHLSDYALAYVPWEREWWLNRSSICTCGAWRTPYQWCSDGCAFVRPKFCVCGHLEVDHDLDDGCGACALTMRGPCREFR